jgi:GWxTD domain-containing protein
MNRLLALLLLMAAPGVVGAQQPVAPAGDATPAPIEQARSAYEERRFPEAVAALERILDGSAENAEAHYLLARVLNDRENPLRDSERASVAVRRAVDLEPDNLLYLVARLEDLRADVQLFVIDLLRARQRVNLARRILRLDPDNPFAHEELGVEAIRDFYEYRNAVTLPGVAFQTPGTDWGLDDDRKIEISTDEGVPELDALPLRSMGDLFEQPGAILTSNRFDVNELTEQGVEVLSLSRRASRAYDAAIEHLRTALAADPRRRSVYDHMVRLAAISDDWTAVMPTLGEMYVQFPADPQMWLYTGLANHRLGQYEAADVSFRQAITRMSDADREAFTDLRMLLPPAEWPAYEAAPEAFSQRYWASRDPRFLNGVNERSTEHFARLTEADLLFAADDLDLPGWRTARGEIFVRFGPPQNDWLIDGDFALVVEQYADRFPGFAANEALVGANRFNVWDYGTMQFVFEDPGRRGEFRLYSPPADLFALSSARNIGEMDYVQRTAEIIRETPEQYRFVAPGRQVQLPYRVTAFKGEGGQTDLYVNYGIPLGEADGASSGDVDVTVKTGAFLIGPARDLLVERRRTVYGLRGAQIVPFKEARLWTTTEQLSARPTGTHEVSIEFETSSGGTSGVQRRAIDIPDFSGDGLVLSDILLAYVIEEEDRATPGRVYRNGMSVQPAPWGVFAVEDPVYLYVEIYGLALEGGRSDYELEARLEPKDTSRGLARVARRLLGRRDRGVSSAFEGDGGQTDDWRDLILDASAQAPGLYTLTVTVRDRVSGRTAEQQTDLLLE